MFKLYLKFKFFLSLFFKSNSPSFVVYQGKSSFLICCIILRRSIGIGTQYEQVLGSKYWYCIGLMEKNGVTASLET